MENLGSIVVGSFDNLGSRHVRFFQEAARLGRVHVLLWSDEAVEKLEGKAPKFPQQERRYLLEAIRYVDRVTLCADPVEHGRLPPHEGTLPATWVVDEAHHSTAKQAYCRSRGLQYSVLREEDLAGFPKPPEIHAEPSSRKRVIVTGCYDWFHSGHVRFFEEVSELGDLYVVVGHDANLRSLKGEEHPLFPESQRQYLVQSIRYVKQALIATGWGWLDAEPEIRRIQPHVYAVIEDGDRGEKRQYCQAHGIEYRVL